MSNNTDSPLSNARLALREATHANENKMASSMLENFRLNQAARDNIVETAHAIVSKSREMTTERGTLDAFMQEFGLSNQEGVALMCLAEALLRIPNAETQDALIAEKISSGNWADHRGSSQDLFVNAGALIPSSLSPLVPISADQWFPSPHQPSTHQPSPHQLNTLSSRMARINDGVHPKSIKSIGTHNLSKTGAEGFRSLCLPPRAIPISISA